MRVSTNRSNDVSGLHLAGLASLLLVAPAAAVISCGISIPDTACHKAGAYSVYEHCNNVMVDDPSCPTVRTAYFGETGHTFYIPYGRSCVYYTYTYDPLTGKCNVVELLNSPSVTCDELVLESPTCAGSGSPPAN